MGSVMSGGSGIGDLSHNETVAMGTTGGMFAGTLESYKSRKAAERQAKEAREREANRQATIANNLRRVREMFGVDPFEAGENPGEFIEVAPEQYVTRTIARDPRDRFNTRATTRTVTNPAYSAWLKRRNAHQALVDDWQERTAGNAQARNNRTKLEGWLDDYSGAVTDANVMDLNDQFTTATTANRWALADRGLLGGSVDAGTQRDALSQLVAGRQKAVAAGRDARRSAQSSLTSQRLNLENIIAAGTNLNPDFQALQDQTQMGLDQARSQLLPSAVGNQFAILGSAAGQHQAAQGGRRGGSTSPLTTSAGLPSGTIT